MHTFTHIQPLRAYLADHRRAGRSIGLVPTMGYLHEGHLSLMRRARGECDVVAVSIFVNPTQFGSGEDFEQYPRDFGRDAALCEGVSVDVILHPPVEEMYPDGPTLTTISVAEVTQGLCGRSRPHHFAGVATVVAKLLSIFGPDRAYFGEKDYQQLVVVRTMVRDLNLPVEIVGCPTLREPDGLAMSSRNAYLAPEERRQAALLYRALESGRAAVARGESNPERVSKLIRAETAGASLAEVDYLEVVDPDTLQALDRIEARALLAVAVRFGRTRLIDNMIAP